MLSYARRRIETKKKRSADRSCGGVRKTTTKLQKNRHSLHKVPGRMKDSSERRTTDPGRLWEREKVKKPVIKYDAGEKTHLEIEKKRSDKTSVENEKCKRTPGTRTQGSGLGTGFPRGKGKAGRRENILKGGGGKMMRFWGQRRKKRRGVKKGGREGSLDFKEWR